MFKLESNSVVLMHMWIQFRNFFKTHLFRIYCEVQLASCFSMLRTSVVIISKHLHLKIWILNRCLKVNVSLLGPKIFNLTWVLHFLQLYLLKFFKITLTRADLFFIRGWAFVLTWHNYLWFFFALVYSCIFLHLVRYYDLWFGALFLNLVFNLIKILSGAIVLLLKLINISFRQHIPRWSLLLGRSEPLNKFVLGYFSKLHICCFVQFVFIVWSFVSLL